MKKHIWKIDLVIILVSLGALIWVVGYAEPLVIAPLDGARTVDGDVLFEFSDASVFEIDDNMEFSSPERYSVDDGLRLDLGSGVYYWKVVGIGSSEVRTLTIESEVSLELVDEEGSWKVVNAGNTRLNLEVYDGDELVEERSLEVGEMSEKGDKFVGGWDG